MTGSFDFITMLSQSFVSLIIVLGLVLLTITFLRRVVYRHAAPPGANHLISVVSSTMIAPKKGVAIIRVADQFLVVGFSESDMRLLTELTNPVTVAALQEPVKATIPFTRHLSSVLERIKR